MASIAVGVCGPVGAKLSRQSLRDTLLTFAGGLGFVVSFSRFWRVEGEAAGSTLSLLFALGAGASAGVMAWGFARLIRRQDHWAIVQVGPLAFVAVFYVAAIAVLKSFDLSRAGRIAVALAPLPFFAAFLVAEIRLLRQLDELERRIQLEALAIAFPLALLMLMGLGLLERAIALSPADWSYRHTWFYLPIFYFVGLAIARRRYR